MIDSIVFRINDLNANKGLIAFLHRKHEEGLELRRKDLVEPFDPNQEIKYSRSNNAGDRIYRFYVDHANGNTFSQTYRNHLKSYLYDISYTINFSRDFIEFSLSLPKYFFGNNLMQLVPHFNDKFLGEFRQQMYFQLVAHHWLIFKGAFNSFMQREFVELVPEKCCIQFQRLDFCFNLFFDYEKDLIAYQNFLKSVKKRYAHANTKHSPYDNSVFYPSSTHTFKIYHKGPEFRKHDYKIIAGRGLKGLKTSLGTKEYSERKSQRVNRADQILHLANLCLRFEVAFKVQAMSEIWWEHKAPKFFKIRRDAYMSFKNNGYFIFDGVRYPQEGTDEKQEDRIFAKLPKDLKYFLKEGKFLHNRYVKFSMDSEEKCESIKDFTFNVPFTFDLFRLMLEKFQMITSQFQIGKVKELAIIHKAIEYTEMANLQNVSTVGYKIQKIMMIAEFLKTKSWQEIYDTGFFSRGTYYKYKKFFQRIGYGDVNSELTSMNTIDYTYSTYYDKLRPIWDNVSEIKVFPFFY